MKSYTVKSLAEIISAKIIGKETSVIEQLFFDSRIIIHSKNAVFFALDGKQKNGHLYIEDAYQKGIRCFVVHSINIPHPDASYLIVDSPLQALQEWAKYHRNLFHIPIIGITGSNGKTIVKEWFKSTVWKTFHTVRSPKSYNSQIGLPVSILQMEEQNGLGLFEAGISAPNEMNILVEILQPNIGILNNVGSAHLENFNSIEELIHEKLKLFKYANTLISDADNLRLQSIIKQTTALEAVRQISFGRSEEADVRLNKVHIEKDFSCLEIQIENKVYKINIPFKDEASIQNVLACVATLHSLKLNISDFIEGFSTLMPIEMRLEIIEGVQNNILINDSFNSDFNSIKIGLDLLSQQIKERKSLVLTDVLQSNLDKDKLYRKVADLVNSYALSKVFLIGAVSSQHQNLFTSEVRSFNATNDFLSYLKTVSIKDEAILLKGARSFHLERISTYLEKKSHDTVLEVNLQALIDNVNYFRSKLKPTTKTMAMVKANSYGIGSFEVAHILEHQKIDYLGVAYADEGAELRKAGITLPIIVANPEQSSYSTLIDSQLEPEIYSFRELHLFLNKLKEKSISNSYPIHIKIETGMNRLGFHAEELDDLIQALKSNPSVSVQSIFTHLAAADMPEESAFSLAQLSRFDIAYEKITSALNIKPIKHALNSSGIIHFPEYQYDMVRLGIGMFGYTDDGEEVKQLKAVVQFKTVISQISILKEGETVSYGRRFTAKEKTKIATIPVGYADGIRRSLGNGKGKVLIKDELVPIVGSVCMDMMMIDVTSIECAEGDEVIIFGNKPSLKEMADLLDTIPYEVLTSISPRVKRIYFKE